MLVSSPSTTVSREQRVEPGERLVAVGAERDRLREHRVVVAADDEPLDEAAVHAEPLARGLVQREHRSGGRQEVRGPGTRRRCGPRSRARSSTDVVLGERERLAGRDAQLLLDQVEAGDELGDRVLDLQPGVHLDEEELVGGGVGDEELDGARALVVDAAGDLARRLADAGAGRRRRAAATAPPR